MPASHTPAATANAVRIGIDGGGTKTDLILVDGQSGQLLAQRRAPGCSPSHLDKATIKQLITENISALLAEAVPASSRAAPAVTHCCLCTAGAPPFWQSLAAELARGPTPLGQVYAYDDSLPVLELATDGGPGLVLHTGTGSFVAARGLDARTHYAGGLGWRIGDQGSAYDLGKRAAERTLLELQGWAAPSALGQAVRDMLQIHKADTLLEHIYNTPENGTVGTALALPTLAPLVTTHAAQGDPAALSIIEASVRDLAELGRAVSERLFGDLSARDRSPGRNAPVASMPNAQPSAPAEADANSASGSIRVGLGGPILQSTAAQRIVAETLAPRHQIHCIHAPPLEGLRRLLIRL